MFILRNLHLFPFFDAPGDDGGSGGELSRDLADLADDPPDGEEEGEGDDPTGDEEDGEGDGEEEGEGDEEEEEEGEETPPKKKKKEPKEGEEGDEEDEEEEPEAGPLTVKGIKTFKDGKYADLFKDFPSLRTAYFEHQKFVEVFPDVASAQDAAGKAAEYDQLEDSLVNKANPEFLLKTLAENAPRSLNKLMKNFGESLKEQSEEAYRLLATPILEELLYHASEYGKRTGGQQGKNIELAAKHIANFIWTNGGEIPDITKRAKKDEPSEAEQELLNERESYRKERFQGALETVETHCRENLAPVISAKLEGLTPFEKKAVIREVRAEVNDKLMADKGFQSTLRSLWKKSSEDNYSQASKARIQNAWLARAKALAPPIRQRLKQEALDARKPRREGDANEEPRRKRTFGAQGGRNSGRSSSRVLNPSKIDWKQTSDADILSDDSGRVTLKK